MAQIGTIRLQTQNNGTVDVPVFDVGDSGSSVYEFVRVQTAGGTGFIPVVDPADASFPYLRVQSQNQGVVAVHNEASLFGYTDNFNTFDSSVWTLYGVASYDSSNNRVDVIRGSDNDGALEYNDGVLQDAWFCEWDNIYIGGNYERQRIYFFADSVGSGNDNNKEQGINQAYSVQINYAGDMFFSEIENEARNRLVTLRGEVNETTSHTFRLEYDNGTVRHYTDGSENFSHTLSNPTKSNGVFFFKGISGGNSADNDIDNVTLGSL